MQQVGSARGLATLVTLALRYAGHQIRHGVPPAVAQTHGYALSFRTAPPSSPSQACSPWSCWNT